MSEIKMAEIVRIIPARVWATKDFMGTVRIYRQHEGDEEVHLVAIEYDHRHLQNSAQRALADIVMNAMGGGEWA